MDLVQSQFRKILPTLARRRPQDMCKWIKRTISVSALADLLPRYCILSANAYILQCSTFANFWCDRLSLTWLLQFSSLEPHICCKLVFIKDLELLSGAQQEDLQPPPGKSAQYFLGTNSARLLIFWIASFAPAPCLHWSVLNGTWSSCALCCVFC